MTAGIWSKAPYQQSKLSILRTYGKYTDARYVYIRNISDDTSKRFIGASTSKSKSHKSC